MFPSKLPRKKWVKRPRDETIVGGALPENLAQSLEIVNAYQ